MFCISNNCFSGFLYRQMGIQYNHPFVWCRVNETDMLSMILKWKSIKWSNFMVTQDATRNIPRIKVDGTFSIQYPHYIYSADDIVPRTTVLETNGAVNVRYCDPLNYASHKYESRIARMPTEMPAIVIVHDFFLPGNSDDEVLKQIVALCNEARIKLFTISCKRPFLQIQNTEWVHWIDLDTPFPVLPEMVKAYKDELLSFIG